MVRKPGDSESWLNPIAEDNFTDDRPAYIDHFVQNPEPLAINDPSDQGPRINDPQWSGPVIGDPASPWKTPFSWLDRISQFFRSILRTFVPDPDSIAFE